MKLTQALNALEQLAEQLGLPGGLQGWEEVLQKATQSKDRDDDL